MQVLPIERHYETFSYLPQLTTQQVAKQIQYALVNGFVPCIEFSPTGEAEDLIWTMWKLPLFGAQSAEEVLSEVQACKQAFPKYFIRVVAFDSFKQVQVMSYLVHKPI
uniref:Multifunctional fusion protein n=1 Tax=Gloeochaete wittrockiana TaxID=38269 RepID=A0A3G1IWE8_9EUKA|nr:ribulose-1,5-bisphosphate carboxylase/oxygenase small subunit [Gloeochaete wittrockiana]ASQ40282.1 ribulose-1,5-bisphosphate carboxylase/oxygenase small subunit [Gloeochaete wittrockiana]